MSRTDIRLSGYLDPRRIEVYLMARGWRSRRRTSMFSTWTAPDDATHPVTLFLPLSSSPRDFEERLQDFVQALASTEDQDRDTVITNLRYATSDLVRIRLASPRVGAGELPISDGADLFEGAREMMLAAACATVNPRPSFGPRMPQQAIDYLEQVKVGRTELGSYVVTIISDVEPTEQQNLLPNEAGLLDIPFERHVTTRLALALNAAHRAADSVLADEGTFDVFDQAVEDGVSANLCAAIAKMGAGRSAATVQVNLGWASSPPPSRDTPATVAFEASSLPVIKDAVAHLRQLGPFENEIVEGFVSRLTRGNDDENGAIVIDGEARGARRSIHVELSDEQYGVAIDAHRNRRPLKISGTLFKGGKSWVLSEPSQLAFED